MPFASKEFRDALGCFATGVCVVTCQTADGRRHGVTVNSFSSVSLDPPLVLFSLDRGASTFAPFMEATHFAVNMLSREQIDLSRIFAERAADRWNGVEYETWETGSPILPGSLAALECDMHSRHDGGDHVIILGRVRGLRRWPDRAPLLYFRGAYQALAGE